MKTCLIFHEKKDDHRFIFIFHIPKLYEFEKNLDRFDSDIDESRYSLGRNMRHGVISILKL